MTALEELRVVQPPACDECPAGGCQFRRDRVYRYLIVMRQARIAREPFAEVLLADVRSSRTIEPWLRGGGKGAEAARNIGLALEDIGRRHGIDVTNAHNAERVSKLLCPERWSDGIDEVSPEDVS